MINTKKIFIVLTALVSFNCNNQQDAIPLVKKDAKDNRPLVNEYNKKLEENSVLTIQQLDTTKDDKLEDKVMYNLYSKMDDKDGEDESILIKLSKPRQFIYSMYELEQEVNNGGFSQYFLNNKGKLTAIAIEGLKNIKAFQFSAVTARADSVFRLTEQSSKSKLYHELDKEFHDLYQKENLFQLKVDYIRSNLQYMVDK